MCVCTCVYITLQMNYDSVHCTNPVCIIFIHCWCQILKATYFKILSVTMYFSVEYMAFYKEATLKKL